ncbi:C-type lectin domain family 9 member A-like isoform X2 [Camelus bactrianus]|uniref:C-type lectin domain family 9 member A-like isoform X2 n=1 Tax=Camelus bactrianus TaxID=9837 RepID=A0A9W3HC05_CAMBA
MTEKYTTYAEVQNIPSKKQMQKKKMKEQLIDTEVKTCTSKPDRKKVTRTELPEEKVFQGCQGGQLKKSPLDNVKQEDNSTVKNTTFKEELLSGGRESSMCETKWSCCGQKCYYFANESKTFDKSQKFCKKMNSRLLKIENDKELNFIQSQLSYFHWIGLSRKGTGSSWTWEDKSSPFLKIDWKESEVGNCASLAATRMVAADCSTFKPYICEK